MKITGKQLRDAALNPHTTREYLEEALIKVAHQLDTNDAVERIRKIGTKVTPMFLHLFHGRDDVKADLSDWGFDGPVLRIEGFHVTYLSTFRIATSKGGWVDLECDNGCVYYDGKWYGDWSILAEGTDNALTDRALDADPNKMDIPRPAPVPSVVLEPSERFPTIEAMALPSDGPGNYEDLEGLVNDAADMFEKMQVDGVQTDIDLGHWVKKFRVAVDNWPDEDEHDPTGEMQ